jgi:large subunit ribosomal protein L27
MAKTKAAGAAKRNVDVAGKRLGIKRFGGEFVKPGNIILRQRGTRFYPGKNTDMGRDHTIFAVAEGFVFFRNMTGPKRGQKIVDILPQATTQAVESLKVAKGIKTATKAAAEVVAEAKPKKAAAVKAEKPAKAEKAPAKKPAAKKAAK